jgi:DNA-directed RNA polymerase specialized sigma24 family protein
MLAGFRVGEPPDQRLRQAQREAFARVNWKELFPRLEKNALAHGASPSDAKDPVQTAVAHLLEGRTTWDPAKGPPIEVFLLMTVRRVLSDQRRRSAHGYETPSDAVEDAPDPHADAASSPEATEAREAARLARIRLTLASDTLALQVLDVLMSGTGKPADQAARLGVPVQAIYDARDRLARCARRIAKEDAEEQELEGRASE